jgi:hypothetical protein
MRTSFIARRTCSTVSVVLPERETRNPERSRHCQWSCRWTRRTNDRGNRRHSLRSMLEGHLKRVIDYSCSFEVMHHSRRRRGEERRAKDDTFLPVCLCTSETTMKEGSLRESHSPSLTGFHVCESSETFCCRGLRFIHR